MGMRLLAAFCLTFALAACATMEQRQPQKEGKVESLSCNARLEQAIFTAEGKRVDFQQAKRLFASADYVLAGETHDQPLHHEAQALLVAVLGKQFGHVYFEMLEPAHDRAVADYLAGRIDLAALDAATAWTGRGWPVWESYSAIFAAARQAGAKVSHGNPDREIIRNINSAGFAALPPRMRQELGIRPEGPFAVSMKEVVAEISRHHPLPEDVAGRFAASQYVKDAHMAWRLSQKPKGILIAGRGHVRSDLGVPAHLASRRPDAKIIAIGLMSGSASDREAVRNAAQEGGSKLYDFLWYTGDSCAARDR